MNKIVIAVLLCSITAAGFTQTAKVIALSPEDAKQAKALDDEQKALNVKKEAFESHIRSQYLLRPHAQCFNGDFMDSKGRCSEVMWGWGFIYSDDFKYIVPKPEPPQQSKSGWIAQHCNADGLICW